MRFGNSSNSCGFGGNFSYGSLLTFGAVAVFGAVMKEWVDDNRNAKEELLKIMELHFTKELMDVQEEENRKRELSVISIESDGKISREEAKKLLENLKT